MNSQVRIAIAGAGISGFATLGYLVEALRALPLAEVTIYWLQPPREIQTKNLSLPQRDRLIRLKNIGFDPSQLLGCGEVYHPAAPSLFTFNGDSAARGFNFATGRYDTTDYFEWIQTNRNLLATLYPDFAPENSQQRHPDHTLDDIHGTTPRGAYGLYLHDRFLALKAQLPKHITLQVIPEALKGFEQSEQAVTLKTSAGQLSADYLVQSTGPCFAKLRPEWQGHVFSAYPCDGYGHHLPSQVAVVGAGAAGIEVALHLLHNLHVEKVTLVSRHAQSRLPQTEPTKAYECQWFTRENMHLRPTAQNAQALLGRELETCYQECQLPYPGWDALLNIEDYPKFLEDYLETTTRSPNHPFAHLMRPVLSFYDRVKDLLPAAEQTDVLQLIGQVKPLFATQSRPCAELMLAAIKAERLKLVAGEFLPAQSTPTILHPSGTQSHPDCVILATGFNLSTTYPLPSQASARCHSVIGTSLSAIHKQAASVASTIAVGVSKEMSPLAILTKS